MSDVEQGWLQSMVMGWIRSVDNVDVLRAWDVAIHEQVMALGAEPIANRIDTKRTRMAFVDLDYCELKHIERFVDGKNEILVLRFTRPNLYGGESRRTKQGRRR